MTSTFTPQTPIWCSGCGHFGVETALKRALAELDIKPHETMLLAGIGCSGTIQNYVSSYGYHALHGRVLPTATGVCAANPKLTVIAAGGDGDGYAIGCGHLIHTLRRNPCMLYIVMNNGTYGLTKGQPSPTAQGRADQEHPVDMIQVGLTIPGSSFLARGYVGQSEQLDRIMVAALEHVRARRGFAFVEVISPCVTFNDIFPSCGGDLVNVEPDQGYDRGNRTAALMRCAELNVQGKLATGIIYEGTASTFEQGYGISEEKSPAHQDISPVANAQAYDRQVMRYRI